MDRRTFLAGTSVVLLAAPLAAEAQQRRIGVLSASVAPPLPGGMVEVVRQTLKELGNGEVGFERRYAEGQLDRLPALAAELVQLKPNVIIAVSTPAIRAVKNSTSTVPVVMAFSGEDPVTAGIVASLARPGGNVTGITILATDLASKRLELLGAALPGVRRIAALTDRSSNIDAQVAAAQEAAKTAGVDVLVVHVEGRDYERAFAALAKRRAEALFVPASTVFFNDRSRVLGLAARYRLPGIYEWRQMTEAGGLMSYGPHLTELYRRVAVYVDKIFNGAKPADLPIEQPTKFELVINLKTAKTLGLTIPPALLQRADEIIQ
jgi:putative ABC transport system substrate-binding protein